MACATAATPTTLLARTSPALFLASPPSPSRAPARSACPTALSGSTPETSAPATLPPCSRPACRASLSSTGVVSLMSTASCRSATTQPLSCCIAGLCPLHLCPLPASLSGSLLTTPRASALLLPPWPRICSPRGQTPTVPAWSRTAMSSLAPPALGARTWACPPRLLSLPALSSTGCVATSTLSRLSKRCAALLSC